MLYFLFMYERFQLNTLLKFIYKKLLFFKPIASFHNNRNNGA